MYPNLSTLVKFDPPVAVGEARKPRALKVLKASTTNQPKPIAQAGTSQLEGKNAPALEDILAALLPPQPCNADGSLHAQPSAAGDAAPARVGAPRPPAQPRLASTAPAGSGIGDSTVVGGGAAAGDSFGGFGFVKFVSPTPATRLDVIHLQEQLDARLAARQAKDTGLCPVRRELYTMAFDELIRQVTINCPERGLLLLRIRDEARQAVEAHRQLFEGSLAFGVRKALVSRNGVGEMRDIISQLETEKAELEVRVLTLQTRCEQIERREQEQRVLDEKARADEVNFYRKTNHQLASLLKAETDRANSKK